MALSSFRSPMATLASVALCLACGSGATDPSAVMLSVVNVSQDSIAFSLSSYGAGTVTTFDPEPFPITQILVAGFGSQGILASSERRLVPLGAMRDYRSLTGITAGVFRVQNGTARLSGRTTVLLDDIKTDGYTIRLSTAR
jgi:hypothetical protein